VWAYEALQSYCGKVQVIEAKLELLDYNLMTKACFVVLKKRVRE